MKSLILLFAAMALVTPVQAEDQPRAGLILAQYATKTQGAPPRPGLHFKARPGGQSFIAKGGCCAKVNDQCVTICNKAGGCTGVGDCITNPN